MGVHIVQNHLYVRVDTHQKHLPQLLDLEGDMNHQEWGLQQEESHSLDMSTDSRVELEDHAYNIKTGNQSQRIYESPIPKAELWQVSSGMTLFMSHAIKTMSLLEGSIYIGRIMCRILRPPRFCISLVNQEEAAHTEGIYLTSLSRAEVRGYREWITSTVWWFIAPFL